MLTESRARTVNLLAIARFTQTSSVKLVAISRFRQRTHNETVKRSTNHTTCYPCVCMICYGFLPLREKYPSQTVHFLLPIVCVALSLQRFPRPQRHQLEQVLLGPATREPHRVRVHVDLRTQDGTARSADREQEENKIMIKTSIVETN